MTKKTSKKDKETNERASPPVRIVFSDVAGGQLLIQNPSGAGLAWLALDLSSAESLVVLASQVGLVVMDDPKAALGYAAEVAARGYEVLPVPLGLALRACRKP